MATVSQPGPRTTESDRAGLVLGLRGRHRGTVRRTGLLWVNPLPPRRRVDVRLRHWRGEPMQAADRSGVALRVAVLLVRRVPTGTWGGAPTRRCP